MNIQLGDTYKVEYDGFVGQAIGTYITREGREGVVLQQLGTKVVHVYGQNRVKPYTKRTFSVEQFIIGIEDILEELPGVEVASVAICRIRTFIASIKEKRDETY